MGKRRRRAAPQNDGSGAMIVVVTVVSLVVVGGGLLLGLNGSQPKSDRTAKKTNSKPSAKSPSGLGPKAKNAGGNAVLSDDEVAERLAKERTKPFVADRARMGLKTDENLLKAMYDKQLRIARREISLKRKIESLGSKMGATKEDMARVFALRLRWAQYNIQTSDDIIRSDLKREITARKSADMVDRIK